ncbi:MAG: hypothetical protein H6590_06610 [Flavobacteriales bacterium]|nr:hypothetical protein [Flavobacteriales bacterium]
MACTPLAPDRVALLRCHGLKSYNYPPEGQEDAIGLVLKQAEVLAEGWS